MCKILEHEAENIKRFKRGPNKVLWEFRRPHVSLIMLHLPFFTSCSTGGGKATSTETWGGTGASASGSFSSSSSSLCPFSWPSEGTTCKVSDNRRILFF